MATKAQESLARLVRVANGERITRALAARYGLLADLKRARHADLLANAGFELGFKGREFLATREAAELMKDRLIVPKPRRKPL